ERAVKNIVKNSYEAGAKNVKVLYEAAARRIVISNDAEPIDTETAKKIFIPFFTTKPGGMGIGLAITKNIVEKHDGKIEYKSEHGNNVFLITIGNKKELK
ncbi:MAG TPA: ATP-binding protein, partial [Candidatus Goldiibacteriota bacterium]|nr:ATP-binding protein [Candidatus Goldiibacteriota bacterium]